METTDIRIRVDSETYSILKEEQSNHKLKTKRTISLANIILHYFNEGINNAKEDELNGLKSISLSNSIGHNDNEDNDLKEDSNFREISINIDKIFTQLNEHDIIIQNKLMDISNNISQNNEPTIYQLEIKNQLNQLQYLISNTKPSTSTDNSSISEIKHSLNKIDRQTQKSTIEKILPYATPILQIISFLMLNKNIKSNKDGENTKVLDQLSIIIEKLPEEEKKLVTDFIDQNIDDIL